MAEKGDGSVGYKKPPTASQFKKGQSGNPRGRPKKQVTLPESVKTKVMRRKVDIHIDGRRQRISMGEALALQVVELAGKGNATALKLAMSWQEDLERQEEHAAGINEEGYAAWLRMISHASDMLEVLTQLGVIYLDEHRIYFKRDIFKVIVKELGLVEENLPRHYWLSTPEIEAGGPTLQRDENLYDMMGRVLNHSNILSSGDAGSATKPRLQSR